MLRVLVHDYSGHPFQVQLSRELAHRGYEVLHHHFAGFQTPKGDLTKRSGDPSGFDVQALDIGEPFAKTSFVKRYRQENRYGHLAADAAQAFSPDVIVASNLPLDPLRILHQRFRGTPTRFIFWWQDIYSVAMAKILPKKIPLFGHAIAAHYKRIERQVCAEADGIVCITTDFVDVLDDWMVPSDKAVTIENWAPLNEIQPANTDNPWAREQDLLGKSVLLYAGTLGLKHNPELLWAAAERLPSEPGLEDARVVVISEGVGAEWLRQRLEQAPTTPLTLLPFQPYERFSEVLASASVVAAILEPEAGVFSVPSKVLSYLAAGRPILLAAPEVNLASKTVVREGAGEVVAPNDLSAFADTAVRMLREPERCALQGANGRSYAERSFDIGSIADRFEALAAWPKTKHLAAA